MRKSRKLVNGLAARYIEEIQGRLPEIAATYDPAESYDVFDGVIHLEGPYDIWTDEDVRDDIYDVAWGIYEQHEVLFFLRYEQKELANSPT